MASNVPFAEYDVTADADALGRLTALTGGRRATPVITVDDEVMVGFDRGRLQRMLGL